MNIIKPASTVEPNPMLRADFKRLSASDMCTSGRDLIQQKNLDFFAQMTQSLLALACVKGHFKTDPENARTEKSSDVIVAVLSEWAACCAQKNWPEGLAYLMDPATLGPHRSWKKVVKLDHNAPLLTASRLGHVDIVKILLNHSWPANRLDALCLAVEHNRLEVARILYPLVLADPQKEEAKEKFNFLLMIASTEENIALFNLVTSQINPMHCFVSKFQAALRHGLWDSPKYLSMQIQTGACGQMDRLWDKIQDHPVNEFKREHQEWIEFFKRPEIIAHTPINAAKQQRQALLSEISGMDVMGAILPRSSKM